MGVGCWRWWGSRGAGGGGLRGLGRRRFGLAGGRGFGSESGLG